MMRWSENSEAQATASGVTVTVPTRVALLSDLSTRMSAGQGFSLATLNLDHVVKLRHSQAFRQAYLEHTHVTADGNPIVWLSRMARQEVELLPGSELIVPIARLAAQHGISVALFGSTQDSLDAAAQGLVERCPELKVATAIAPPMGFDPEGPEALEAIAALKASGAGLCFVALGAPKQEIFAIHAAEALPNMGFVSIGAGLDFISGRQARAPRIVRAVAAEWLWRMALNPTRLTRRYAACIVMLPGLFVEAFKCRLQADRKATQ